MNDIVRIPNPAAEAPVSAEKSRQMSLVRTRHTGPELIVRRILRICGFRYRLHPKKLPGTPDIVFAGRRKAIFVHGCYWHRHGGCSKSSMPKTRVDFWRGKFAATVERDQRTFQELTKLGWQYCVVWECETRCEKTIKNKLLTFLASPISGYAI
ncbi:MAG: DNA mismatch endonuclease Vsr [Magnetococcales bacterium]|nr:DNA mismatch endonuclease Vsr [Magnetococcales bacterium]